MKKGIIGSVIILVYVILLPYACRIWRGIEWVAQYLPDEGHRISGLLYFGGFASLPSIPLVLVFLLRRWIPITYVVSIIVSTSLLVFWHHDYDIALDAQAAIGLIFIPLYVTTITAVVSGLIAVIEFLIRRNRKVANNDVHSI
jgi:hypothetical protein